MAMCELAANQYGDGTSVMVDDWEARQVTLRLANFLLRARITNLDSRKNTNLPPM
jgi:hypothetical protein